MNNEYDYDKMVQSIMTNDDVYKYLIYFYLDEISDWRFEQQMREDAISEREYISRYFAARIPGDQDYDKIQKKIIEIVYRKA